jgi:hypothetical protein
LRLYGEIEAVKGDAVSESFISLEKSASSVYIAALILEFLVSDKGDVSVSGSILATRLL